MLNNEMLKGREPVSIYNNSMSGKRIFEGKAYIQEIHQGDKSGVHATVHFIHDDPGETYKRWVFAKDQ